MTEGPLLIDERVVAVQPSLVRALGLTRAVVLQQIHWHLGRAGHGVDYDGEVWFPVTQAELASETGLTEDVVHRAILALETAGLLLACQPEGHQWRRKWYRIDHCHVLFVHSAESRYQKPRQRGIPSRGSAESSTTQTSEDQQETSLSSTLDRPDPTELVFTAWKEATGRQRSVLDPKRRRLIGSALANYDLDDVLAAVRGWRHSPHHCGVNERHTVYNSLELLLRDSGHIERFRDLELGAASEQAARDPGPLGATVSYLERRARG